MATTHITWYGAIVEFDHPEITQIISHINTGSAGIGALAVTLAAMGITGPAVVVAGIVSALLRLGAALLNGCNSRQAGIFLHVIWVGVPWCRSR
jgi:hypothetical protein